MHFLKECPDDDRTEDHQETLAIKARLRGESRLSARLMQSEPSALHAECEALGLPHDGRDPGELRAALFHLLRRQVTTQGDDASGDAEPADAVGEPGAAVD